MKWCWIKNIDSVLFLRKSKNMVFFLTNDEEKNVKKLKRKLEGWREVILFLHSVLICTDDWYRLIILSTISTVCFFVWLLELSILTMFAMTGISLTLADFIMPTLIANFYANTWTKHKEKTYEDICRSLVYQYNSKQELCKSFIALRESRPFVYYPALIATLFIFAWIGLTVDNLLIMYAGLLVTCLLPGFINDERPGNFVAHKIHTVRRVLGYFKKQK